MKYLTFSSLLLAVYLASAITLQRPANGTLERKRLLPVMPGMGSYPRVLYGKEAQHHQFPFMVGLQFVHNRRYEFCGGVLISNIWVLTAAHCTLNAESGRVFLGMHTRGDPIHDYLLSSNDIVPNRAYDNTEHTADIALVRIPHVDYTDAINRVRLPRKTLLSPSYAEAKAIAIGWGYTNPDVPTLATTLKYIKVRCISNSDCKKTYGSKQIYKGKVCISGYYHKGVCKGDSGGPLVLRYPENSVYTLIGIYSFGSCAGYLNGEPQAFTRVYNYLKWIHDNTGIPV